MDPEAERSTQLTFGESGPWVDWLPNMWHILAWPDHPIGVPSSPGPAGGERDDRSLFLAIKYWSPLPHLLMGALGWVDPALGIANWIAAGRPTSEPTLRLLERWWGSHITAVLEWQWRSDALRQASVEVHEAVGGVGSDWPRRRHSFETRREDSAGGAPVGDLGTRLWAGGTDPLHLGPHCVAALVAETDNSRLATDSVTGRAVLAVDSYLGWYRSLAQSAAMLPPRPDGHSWRVDVVVRPLGWLGTYRKSRDTGRWFTGPHRSHLLGWPSANS
jgi:hypothetical protein